MDQLKDQTDIGDQHSLMIRGQILQQITDEQEIRSTLSNLGYSSQIKELRIIPSKDFGFVEFWNPEDAVSFKQSFPFLKIRGHPVQVQFAKQRQGGPIPKKKVKIYICRPCKRLFKSKEMA